MVIGERNVVTEPCGVVKSEPPEAPQATFMVLKVRAKAAQTTLVAEAATAAARLVTFLVGSGHPSSFGHGRPL